MGIVLVVDDFPVNGLETVLGIEPGFVELGLQNNLSPTERFDLGLAEFKRICTDFKAAEGLQDRHSLELETLRIQLLDSGGGDGLVIEEKDQVDVDGFVVLEFFLESLFLDENFLTDYLGFHRKVVIKARLDHNTIMNDSRRQCCYNFGDS